MLDKGLILFAVVLYLPAMARLFYFEPLASTDMLTALAPGGISVFWFEVIKFSRRLKLGS